MKTIIQLAIAALVINAAVQAARVYWNFYEFKDAVEEAALYGREATASEMHQRVLEIAAEHGIDVAWGDIQVDSDVRATSVDVTYEKAIPFVPGYSRLWPFNAEVSVRRSKPLRMDEALK